MTGSITVVGIGPGDLAHMTPAAREAVETADIILGYRTYLRLIASLAPAVAREPSGMRQEVSRAQRAVELARAGRRVALISGGDAGIYGMSGLVYEVLREQEENSTKWPLGSDHVVSPAGPESAPTVEVVPGISALNAAASLLGAPLMTDFATVSLSDHLVSCADIIRRVELAAQADFVLCLYNPKGRNRSEPFRLACEALARHRRPDTPVGIVRSAYRAGQRAQIVRLRELPAADIDMFTIVIVGNSQTAVYGGKLLTPRGYAGKYDLGEREEPDTDASA